MYLILYHTHKDPSSNIVSHDADHDAAHISYLQRYQNIEFPWCRSWYSTYLIHYKDLSSNIQFLWNHDAAHTSYSTRISVVIYNSHDASHDAAHIPYSTRISVVIFFSADRDIAHILCIIRLSSNIFSHDADHDAAHILYCIVYSTRILVIYFPMMQIIMQLIPFAVFYIGQGSQ